MNRISKLTFALLLCLTTAAAFSQASTVKPKIFNNYPNTISCQVSQFSSAFLMPEGQHVLLLFSDNFKFSGTIISNEIKYSNLQSVTIRSDESAATIFHLSKQTNTDNSISYVGRIMNANASDGYQIKKDLSGSYKFEKVDADRILQECHL